jgi:hypothetical protein
MITNGAKQFHLEDISWHILKPALMSKSGRGYGIETSRNLTENRKQRSGVSNALPPEYSLRSYRHVHNPVQE